MSQQEPVGDWRQSIREVAQHRDKQKTHPDWMSTAPVNQVISKNRSGRPMHDFKINRAEDPVANIAMQNPVAQPGGGSCRFQQSSPIIAQIYGIMDRSKTPTALIYNDTTNVKTKNGAWMKPQTQRTPEDIEDGYFASGARKTGAAFYIPSNGAVNVRGIENGRRWNSRHGGGIHGVTKRFSEHERMEDGCSIVYTRTSVTPAAQNPVNSGSVKKRGHTMPHRQTGEDHIAEYPRTNTEINVNAFLFKNY